MFTLRMQIGVEMNDLISRQKAIDALGEKPIGDTDWDLGCQNQWEWDTEILRTLSSAEPEIIRCKDCKHKPSGSGANHDISFPDGVCPCQCEDYWYSWVPKDDWYCADAERRTDE